MAIHRVVEVLHVRDLHRGSMKYIRLCSEERYGKCGRKDCGVVKYLKSCSKNCKGERVLVRGVEGHGFLKLYGGRVRKRPSRQLSEFLECHK